MKQFLIYLCLFVLSYAPVSQAQLLNNQTPANHVDIRLAADTDMITPSKKFQLLILQDIEPGWHTYWINPGDSGAPSKFDIKSDSELNFEDIAWPAPVRIPYQTLTNFGYEDSAGFTVPVTAPHEIDANEITITVEASWLVCKDICIPERTTKTLTLPVGFDGNQINGNMFNSVLKSHAKPLDIDASFEEQNQNFILTLPNDAVFANETPKQFFPATEGLIQNAPEQTRAVSNDKIILSAPRGRKDLSAIETVDLIIKGDNASWAITADKKQSATAMPAAKMPPVQEAAPIESDRQLVTHILLAILGGIILNLMPCVFPVLSLKALSVVEAHGHKRRMILKQGFAYTLGILISFAIFAAIILSLRAAGHTLGWGFHLQNPMNILFLSYLMFAIGLSLAGFFNISGSFMRFGHNLTVKDTAIGSFWTGVLAAVVATPCTAPFMAGAIGYAASQPVLPAFAIFLSVGLGLALPYLILSIVPALQKALPRPGAWMESFKEFLSFPMFLTAIWLLWVLSNQSGSNAVFIALIGMVMIGLMVWAIQLKNKMARIIILLIAALALILSFASLPENTPQTQDENAWSPASFETAIGSDAPVFINMTASWCITCKVNERTTLKTDQVQQLFEQQNVTYLVGDWTNENPDITAYLATFERNGVPLYVYYATPENGLRPAPIVLPQILTPGILEDAITK